MDPIATDPPVSEPQRRAMFAAASGNSTLGIPKEVGEHFVGKDQTGPFLAGVRNFLRGLMQWVSEEEGESEHGDDETAHDPHTGQFTGSGGGSSGPPKEFERAHKVAGQHGFKYEGTNEKGGHKWSHPSGATLTTSKGGIGRGTGSHLATVQTGPNSSKTEADPVWPENAVRRAINKAGIKKGDEADDNADALPLEKPDVPGGANDMAFDRSVRSKDADGRLHVASSNISKATVNPYPGEEIPDWQSLGLDPKRVYMLLRHPDELSKPDTIDSFNNLQILSEHVPVSTDTADSHRADLTIGSLGTDAAWNPPYLTNSLVFWAKPAIEAIEADEMKELSCAYRYDADMTPGTYEGQRYDGVMRNLVGNHLALVKKGRAGPDVVVGDSAENLQGRMGGELKEDEMPKFTPAMLAGGFKKALSGVKLKSGTLAQDANIDEILPLIETIIGSPDETADQMTMPAMNQSPTDLTTAPNAAIPMGGSADEEEDRIKRDCRAADARRRLGRDETDEEREKREGEDAAADAADKAARDAAKAKDGSEAEKEDKEEAGDKATAKATDSNGFRNVTGDKAITKAAMDQAVSAAVTAALARAARTQSEIREAEKAVRPYVGELAIACDSAEAVYRTALTAMGVKEAATIHASALPALLSYQEKPGATKQRERTVAMDAAAATSFAERFPGADKISVI